jgi:hypothetical protein
MSKSIILTAMVLALCVARLATLGSGADSMQGEGLVMAAQVSQSA